MFSFALYYFSLNNTSRRLFHTRKCKFLSFFFIIWVTLAPDLPLRNGCLPSCKEWGADSLKLGLFQGPPLVSSWGHTLPGAASYPGLSKVAVQGLGSFSNRQSWLPSGLVGTLLALNWALMAPFPHPHAQSYFLSFCFITVTPQ